MQGTSWARGLELIGDDERLVARAGVLPLRLLAQRLGLTCGLSAGMRRRGFDPVYDRGQVLMDLALVLIDGGEAISDFQALAHLAPVIGPVPSTSTVWRTLSETGDLQLARVNAAVAEFRRHWWPCWPPAGGVPVAEGRREGADRDHRDRPGRLDRARGLGQGERQGDL